MSLKLEPRHHVSRSRQGLKLLDVVVSVPHTPAALKIAHTPGLLEQRKLRMAAAVEIIYPDWAKMQSDRVDGSH